MPSPILPRYRVVQTIGAAHCALYGVLLVLFSERYTSRSYAQPFRVLPPAAWGVAFAVSGLIVLGSLYGPAPRDERVGRIGGALAAMVMTSVMVGWSVALVWGVMLGEAGTLAGPLWTMSTTGMYLSSAVRFGTGRWHGRP